MAADRPTIKASTSAAAKGFAGVGPAVAACFCRSMRARSGKVSSLRKGLVRKSNARELNRFDRHGNAAVGGHHNDFQVGQRPLLDPPEQFEAVELGHLQVGHHHVEASGGKPFERLFAVGPP